MVRGVLAVLLGLALVAGTAQAQEDNTPSIETTVAAFEAALDNHDPGRAASFLAEDARALVPNVLDGRNAITQFLIGRYVDDTTIEVTGYAADGQRVTWMTRVTNGARAQFNWDEAVVVDGRIALWSEHAMSDAMVVMPRFQRAGALEPYLAPPAASTPPPRAPAGPRVPWWLLGIGIVAAVCAGVLYGVWRERYHPVPGRSTLQDGRLLRGLRVWHESDTTLSTVRAPAYNAARGYGPPASRNPRRHPDS